MRQRQLGRDANIDRTQRRASFKRRVRARMAKTGERYGAARRVLIEQATDGRRRTWAADPEFAVGPGEFGLNGLDFGADDTLFVVNYAQGELYRIPVEAGGEAGQVELLEVAPGLSFPDGMKRRSPDQLLVVEGGIAADSLIDVAGNAASTTLVIEGLDSPTTAAIVGSDAWVVEGQLDHLFGADPAPPTLPFTVVRVALPR